MLRLRPHRVRHSAKERSNGFVSLRSPAARPTLRPRQRLKHRRGTRRARCSCPPASHSTPQTPMRRIQWTRNSHYQGSADECWHYVDEATRRSFEVRVDREPRCDPNDSNRRCPDRYFLAEFLPNGCLTNDAGAICDVPRDVWSAVRAKPSDALATLARHEARHPGFNPIFFSAGYSSDSVYLGCWEEVDASVIKSLIEDRWYFAYSSIGAEGREHPPT